MMLLPPTLNIHIVKNCNFKCSFCYAHFREAGATLDLATWKSIINELLGNGARKINFAGGEPTLYRKLDVLIECVRGLGGTASIVTNGTGLPKLLATCRPDIVGISIDSASDAVNSQLGRGKGDHATRVGELAKLVHATGARLKINTVVTKLVLGEDMGGFITLLRPERWKLFQVLPIRGENDGKVEPLLITRAEFDAFVARHLHLEMYGIKVVPESNEAMTGSYAMIDPDGRFFDNTRGTLSTSDPIQEVGVQAAWGQVAFSREKFALRGGEYE